MKFATILCLFVASLTVSGLPIEDRDAGSLAIRAKKASVKSKPSASKPVAKTPAIAKPAAVKPVAAKPAAGKPVAAKPAAGKPVAAKPAPVKPVSSAKAVKPNAKPKYGLRFRFYHTQVAQIAPTAAQTASAQKVFAATKNHIFNGETSNPSSGRHTFSSWTSANKDAGRCDPGSKLCVFKLTNTPSKTIFDDRAGGYTQADIQQMCTTAITLNLQAAAAANGKLANGAFVVQTKFGRPICVEHLVADPGSCFPLGIHVVRGTKLNEPCKSTGNNEIKGKTTEIAPRT
ncbi:hypothetical protein C8R47DRAFT_1238837 [Mycena vitilis]|nr:hypothetical protein C8R47DRAFT_1238837 [Mycena vitilis]